MQIVFHWPAVALSVLVGFFVLSLWYSPFALGPLVQRLEGWDEETAKRTLMPSLLTALALVLLQALGLAAAFNFTGSNTFGMGAMAGLQLWLVFSAPALALTLLPARRPYGLLWIHGGGTLLVAVLQGALLASWR